MENERHYFMVGAFVLVAVAMLLVFTMWLTMLDDSKYHPFRIRFAESVSGLSNGSEVKFRGVTVGSVTGISIDPNDSRLIRVDVSLLKNTPLKTDTVAGLKMQGITGGVYIELTGGDPAKPDMVQNREDGAVPEIPAQQSSLSQLIDRVPLLLDKVSATMDQVNKLFSNDNVEAVGSVLKNSNATMSDLHDMIQDSSGNLTQSSRDAAAAMRHLRNAAGHAENVSEAIDEDPTSLLFPAEEKGIPAP